jgi:hypothetical protein
MGMSSSPGKAAVASRMICSGVDSIGWDVEPVAPIERLPKWLRCVPLVVQWLWLSLKYRSVTLPSVLNPQIETGGLVGESKFGYLNRIDDAFARYVAKTAAVHSGDDPDLVRRQLGITYPLIAKPDVGWCGYGVRRINNALELSAYATAFPQSEQFLVQQLIGGVHEAGILYVRRAGEASGRIEAMTIRHSPHVVGDGRLSVGDLIAASPRMARKSNAYAQNMSTQEALRVPSRGERVALTTVASTRVGGRYEDTTALVTPVLEKAVDSISRSMGEFHYGRYDVKFDTLEQLRDGHFIIIEVNGAGSEAIQFWDPRLSLTQAFRGVFRKQRELFALADVMRERGIRPVSVSALISAFMRQRSLIKRYAPSN